MKIEELTDEIIDKYQLEKKKFILQCASDKKVEKVIFATIGGQGDLFDVRDKSEYVKRSRNCAVGSKPVSFKELKNECGEIYEEKEKGKRTYYYYYDKDAMKG